MRHATVVIALLLTAGCAPGSGPKSAPGPADSGGSLVDSGEPVDTDRIAEVQEGEWLPGDIATNTLMLGSNAFLRPAENLSEDHESMFYSGNSWFNQDFVEAPASTDTRDGLGPVQNARTCSGCHFKDGRAEPPDGPEDDPLGTLVRLSIPGTGAHGGPLPDPVYGGQLQDGGTGDVPKEGEVAIEWEDVEGAFDDGTPYTLRHPVLDLVALSYGDLHPEVRRSIRIAPQMLGLGLLEGIPESRLAALEDPDDADGDGVSGRRNITRDTEAGAPATGRFGWKAEQPTVRNQTAGAFAGDMGITTSIVPADDCTEAQTACREAPLEELEGLSIWPYTDLLLHDMGAGLDSGRTVFRASGSEWRPPPLWGLGLVPDVNGHESMLHDGRARGHAEAILWHGGEAERARDAFRAMPAHDRAALIAFLRSL